MWVGLQQPVGHDTGVQTHCPPEQACPRGQAPVEQIPPQPLGAPHFFPAQLGVQEMQDCLAPQDRPLVRQLVHGAPPPPQWSSEVPGKQWFASQQPLGQDALLQTQTPLWHASPAAHAPVWQAPPQPSGAPQFLPVHDGTQAVSASGIVSPALTGPSAASPESAAPSSGSGGSDDSPGQPTLAQTKNRADNRVRWMRGRRAAASKVTSVMVS